MESDVVSNLHRKVGFVDAEVRTVQIRFGASSAAYACNCTAEPYPGCMGSWNKLWGSSRCGYSHPHHQDSDRFVWRRRTLNSSNIAIAAYSCEQHTANTPGNESGACTVHL